MKYQGCPIGENKHFWLLESSFLYQRGNEDAIKCSCSSLVPTSIVVESNDKWVTRPDLPTQPFWRSTTNPEMTNWRRRGGRRRRGSLKPMVTQGSPRKRDGQVPRALNSRVASLATYPEPWPRNSGMSTKRKNISVSSSAGLHWFHWATLVCQFSLVWKRPF